MASETLLTSGDTRIGGCEETSIQAVVPDAGAVRKQLVERGQQLPAPKPEDTAVDV